MLISKVFHNANDPIVLLTSVENRKVFVEANHAFLELFGYSRQELFKLEPRTLCAPEFLKQVAKKKDRFAGKNHFSTEAIGVGKNRLELNLELNVTKFLYEKKVYYLIIARDISEKKWFLYEFKRNKDIIATGLIDNEDYLVNLTRVIPDSIPEGVYVDTSLWNYVSSEDFLRIKKYMTQSRKDKTEQKFSLRYLDPNSSGQALVPSPLIHVTLRPFVNGSGKLVKLAFTASLAVDDQLYSQAAASYDLSNRLRTIMFEKNIKNEFLANATGLSLGTISKLKNGRNQRPRKRTVEKIAKALGVNPDYFSL